MASIECKIVSDNEGNIGCDNLSIEGTLGDMCYLITALIIAIRDEANKQIPDSTPEGLLNYLQSNIHRLMENIQVEVEE